MSNSQGAQTGAVSAGASENHLHPHEWLASLNLPDGARIRPSTSLHADYREATFDGSNYESAISGGISPGFWSFEDGPHDWKSDQIDHPRSAICVLHFNLCHNIRTSSIERHRVAQLLDTLCCDFTRFLPGVDPPNFTPKMIEGLEDHLLLARDHKESLPFDKTTQDAFDEDIVMMLCLVFANNLGYLPTFQRKGVVSPPGPRTQKERGKKFAMVRELCVLEQRFTKLMNIAFVKYPLRYFIRWASYEPVDTTASLAVGPVISLHLFRGRRGIEHEFVLISFGNDGVPTSWLRAERAARAKTSPAQPRWDSFGPLFTGVAPLDTISFSCNKGDLVSTRDIELATLLLVPGRLTPVSGMYIREISEHLAATINDSPDYVLWSTNCRFFARRTLINVAIRFGISHPTEVRHTWDDQKIDSLGEILARLQAERFGGSALIGHHAAVARVKTLIYIASSGGSGHADALRAISEALDILDSFPEVPEDVNVNLRWLRSDCYAEKSRALDNLGLYEESYHVSQMAVELSAPDREVFNTEEGTFWETSHWSHYGRALRMMVLAALRTDRIPEAVNKSLECLAVHRPNVRFGTGALFLERAISNALIFAAASLTTSVEVAIVVAHRAESIFRYLYKVRPDAVVLPFAEHLHSVADFHSRGLRPKLALAASSECIQLYRQVPFMPERHGLTLAHAMADHAQFAAELHEWDESIAAEETALHYLQILNAADPHVHDHRIFRSLMRLRDRIKMTGDLVGALKWSRELESFARALVDSDAVTFVDASLELLADAAYHHGVDASAAEIWDEAGTAFRESIKIHEGRDGALGLGYSYLELSKCISHSHQNSDEAVDLSRRAVDIMRTALDRRPCATPMPLASALSNLAWILFLVAPNEVPCSITAEQECLVIRDEMASEASDDRPLCDINPEPTAQLVASLARLRIYLTHAERNSDAAAAMDRMDAILGATVHSIAGVAERIRNGLIPRLKDEGAELGARGRDSDARACAGIINALDVATVDVDIQALAQRAERARLSRRIMERDDASAEPEDEALMPNALSTMTLDDGEMGLRHGKLLDAISGFAHHSW